MLCRRTSNSDTVKSVISSTKYEKPAEVLATFVTQSDIARREKREAEAFKQNSNRNSNNLRGKNKFGQRGGFNKNQNGQSRDNNDQRDGRGRFQNNRGNGNYRGNHRGGHRCNFNQPRNEQTIRLVAASAPAPTQMVPQNNPQENIGEQFFRLAQ